jgi:hypothetical protein
MTTYTIKLIPKDRMEAKAWTWGCYRGRKLITGHFDKRDAIRYAEWCNAYGKKAVITILNNKGEVQRKYLHQIKTTTRVIRDAI